MGCSNSTPRNAILSPIRLTSELGATGAGSPDAYAMLTQRATVRVLAMLLDLAPLGMFITDVEGTILFANARAANLFGCSRQELMGELLHTFVLGETLVLPAGTSPRSTLVTKGDHQCVRKDCTIFPATITLSSITTADSALVLAVFDDLSERKRMEARFHLLQPTSAFSMVLVDEQGNIELANAETERMFGYSRNELLGQPVTVMLPPQLRDGTRASLRASFLAHALPLSLGVGLEICGLRKDGTEFAVEIGLDPLTNPDGAVKRVLMSVVDIAERRRLENRFSLIVNASSDGILLVNSRGVIMLANRAVCRMFGVPQMVGRTVDDAVILRSEGKPVSFRSAFLSETLPLAVGDERDFYARRTDESEFPVEVSRSSIVTEEDGVVFLCTLFDISERKRLEALRAKKALLTRSALLATVSHELRTPLTGVIGTLELLGAIPDLPADARSLVATSRYSSDTLLTIINNVLDYSKLEAGSLRAERVVFDPREVVSTVAGVMSVKLADKSLSLVVDIGPDVPRMVLGDRNRLQQVLLNLCANAAKFTERGGITVAIRTGEADTSASPAGGPTPLQLCIDVTDTGIGITPAAQSLIFEPFVQADVSTTRQFGGTGLGLAICKQLVTMMGGTINVRSVVGEGSCFSFSVRVYCTAAPSAPDGSGSADQVTTSAVAHAVPMPRDFTVAMKDVPTEATAVTTGSRILVVEDDVVSRKVVSVMLQRLGCDVATSINGQQAVDATKHEHFAVILMDCEMPILDGFAAAAEIRQRDGAGAPPIIAMTANASVGDRELCLQRGMNDYLSKPLRLAELAAMLAKWHVPVIPLVQR